MRVKSTAFLVFVVLCGVAVYQVAHYYPLLPERVASHFGAGGEADGWSTKRDFAIFYALILVILAGSFLGSVLLVRYLPPSLINLPNKDYWLAPERKEETLRVVADTLFRMGNVTLVFLLYVMQITIRANLNPPAALGSGIWGALGVYLVVLTAMTIGLVRRFR